MRAKFGMTASLGLAVVMTMAAPAIAHDARHRPTSVVAESNFGKGTVSGAVREGRVGLEVQLPGGSWIPCGRSCSDTLRRQTVDFWDNQANGQDKGRGYLGWGRTF